VTPFSRSIASTCLIICVMSMVVDPIRAQTAHEPHALSRLEFGTGWLLLGALDAKTKKWVTQLKHRGGDTVPRPGDILEMTDKHEVVIVDFAEHGERDRLISSKDRVGHNRDTTPIVLPPGARVKVEEVSESSVLYTIIEVWARVVAAPPQK